MSGVAAVTAGGAAPALEAVGVAKRYRSPAGEIEILRAVDLAAAPGEAIAILGPSGSGKSTLLHVLGALEPPSAGRVSIAGADPYALAEPELARFRNRTVGFVFQEHYLLPQYSALENVLLPTMAHRDGAPGALERARHLLERVGLGARLDHRPPQLSGGERQRAAVARALVNRPAVLLGDEPTGSLDRAGARGVADLLFELRAELGAVLVVVTHSLELAERFDRRFELVEGVLVLVPSSWSLLRTLVHHWRPSLGVMSGAALTTAVLTGALLMGDSVRGSLRGLAEERLGRVEQVVVAEGFFPSALAARLAADPALAAASVAPAIALRGGALAAASGARAADVAIHGVDPGFGGLFVDRAGPVIARHLAPARERSGALPPVVLNEFLARELGVDAGDDLLLSLPRFGQAPRGSLLGSREAEDVSRMLRVIVDAVVPDRGAGSFSLQPRQGTPRNVFLPLAELGRAVGRPGDANLVLVGGAHPGSLADEAVAGALRPAVSLADLDLALRGRQDHLSLESGALLLRDEVAVSATAAAAAAGATARPLLTYLANRIALGERSVPYSTITAIDPAGGESYDDLRLVSGEAAPRLDAGEILLGEWAAEDLAAAAGDEVELEYYVVGEREELRTERRRLRVRGVVAMEELGADRTLTPELPGIADAGSMADWDPPFPVDLGAIGPRDEEYWERHRATPKAFVALATGRELWSSRFGSTSALRLRPQGEPDLERLRSSLERALPAAIGPAAAGLAVEPVRGRALEAAAGTTDFASLFLGFSMFVLVAAALLVALLFALAVEQRAREAGLLLALGHRRRAVERRLFSEGIVLALCGGALGALAGVGYGALLVLALRTRWLPAVGSPYLELHAPASTVLLGFAISLAVVTLAMAWALRRLRRLSPRALLHGPAAFAESGPELDGRRRGIAAPLAVGALVAALALAGWAAAAPAAPGGPVAAPALAMGAGTLMLIAGIAAFAAWCRRFGRPGRAPRIHRIAGLAAGNSARAPRRSRLSVALVACAVFVLVVVAANRGAAHPEGSGRGSGAGGYQVVAEAAIPLPDDLASAAGRAAAGIGAELEELLQRGEVMAFRLVPGDDTSCLNLFRPLQPRLLGVPRRQVERGGFAFQSVLEAKGSGNAGNPWALLDQDLGPGVVPALGDANSVRWILHRDLGDEMVVRDERGEELRLRIVGLLAGSVFQSELLISEANLVRHYPSRSGFSYLLLEADVIPSESEGPGRMANPPLEADVIPSESEGPGRVRNPPLGADVIPSESEGPGRVGGAKSPRMPQDAPTSAQHLARTLEADLGTFGVDATTTSARLAGFRAVEETYLGAFETLGGLGLLLGTVGLAIVLIRGVAERRGELAALRAFGFRRRTVAWLVLAESAFLLLVGLAIGATAGLVAALPYRLAAGGGAAGASLAATLSAILVCGLGANAVAVAAALRARLLPTLKAE